MPLRGDRHTASPWQRLVYEALAGVRYSKGHSLLITALLGSNKDSEMNAYRMGKRKKKIKANTRAPPPLVWKKETTSFID